ncbi:MAG TPA: class I SAM-dependent methyltransferase, partial [Gammaproteobacteria bacterium]|nr:class I SAM-dependent methyltransferase [Gammaproteobacteria bacterium]
SGIIAAFERFFPQDEVAGPVLDLGCGPGDIAFRFAERFPDSEVIGVDGAAAMISLAQQRKDAEVVTGQRVSFIEGLLPDLPLPRLAYAAIISNSLLHHLHDPAVLWEVINRYAVSGTRIFIADLYRPQSTERARDLLERYAAAESEVLRRDFYHSLCAAFEPGEISVQLDSAGLQALSVDVITDRHLVVHGVMA